MKWLCALSLILASMLAVANPAKGASVLAEGKFWNGAEEYRGVGYFWMANGDLRVTIEVEPKGGQAVELLWGAKGDEREAVVVINGKEQVVKKGGYDGFEWVRVAVPEGVAGKKYEVVVRATGVGRAAFVGGVRLVGEKAAGDVGPAKIAYAMGPAGGEAFAEMRGVWDRERVGKELADERVEGLFVAAERNGRAAGEALYRCRKFVEGWLKHADPKTGLIPRNLTVSKDLWNGRDSAADNYPFMVLTCALTDRGLFEGRMKEMLAAEMRVTKRVDRLPDDYLFSKGAFAREPVNLEATIFDSAEYVKDGLLPLTEWLGRSEWSERMVGIMEDIWKNAKVETPYGRIPTTNFEVNGDLLQGCARLYWFTGERKYLDWAIRLGDYYLLGNQHPTRDLNVLRLCDHGCEMVNGLSELYVAVSVAAPSKREAYRKPIHEMMDRILEVGRNEDGMLWSTFNTKTGEHSKDVCDTWGYDYDAIYTVYLLDKTEAYREAVRKAMGNLKGKYVGAAWGDKSADGYADSIEGAINLLNREHVESAAEWVDSQIRMMWGIQKRDGVIEGWHGDGNGARTSIMYALWKTQGVRVEPWRADVRVGAVRDGKGICVSLSADQPWKGRVVFDRARHRVNMRLPMDYPRINQFPEWFVVEEGGRYGVKDVESGKERVVGGKEMAEGVEVEMKGGEEVRWRVEGSGV